MSPRARHRLSWWVALVAIALAVLPGARPHELSGGLASHRLATAHQTEALPALAATGAEVASHLHADGLPAEREAATPAGAAPPVADLVPRAAHHSPHQQDSRGPPAAA